MELQPMTGAEFDRYINLVCKDYAEEQVKAGSWPADKAIEMAVAETHELLPNGLATPNHHFYSITTPAEPAPVGVLWIMVRDRNGQKEIFIDDILIHDPYRRKGYASQALILLEQVAREMGIHRIRLQVFGHNQEAISLYNKTGYKTINIYMEKQVP